MAKVGPSETAVSVPNLRDVGQTVNAFLGRRFVREGLLYRSARPDDASVQDQTRLVDELGIKSILDLRTPTEHRKQAQKQEAEFQNAAANQFDVGVAGILQIPGMAYHRVNITGRAFEVHLIRQLSWLGFFQFVFYLLLGYRLEGIGILAREVMLPRGLVGIGLDTMDQSHTEIAMALKSFAQSPGLPTLVHCTQGKDRTGLVIALLLMIMGVPLAAIEHDYALTDQGLRGDMEQRLAEIWQIGLTEEWASTDPRMIKCMADHLSLRYGGLNGYLDAIGFSDSERSRTREMLLC